MKYSNRKGETMLVVCEAVQCLENEVELLRDEVERLLTALMHIAAACNVNHKASEAEEHGATPAIAAVQNDAIDCLQLLLACPSLEIDRSDSWGLTPVHHAARMHVGFDCRDHLHVNLSVRPRALHMLWVSE